MDIYLLILILTYLTGGLITLFVYMWAVPSTRKQLSGHMFFLLGWVFVWAILAHSEYRRKKKAKINARKLQQ